MEYCCCVLGRNLNCYFEILDMLQNVFVKNGSVFGKWICRTFGPSLAGSVEPIGHC